MLDNNMKSIGSKDVNYYLKRELVKEVEFKLYKVFNDFIHKYIVNSYDGVYYCIEKNSFKESDILCGIITINRCKRYC